MGRKFKRGVKDKGMDHGGMGEGKGKKKERKQTNTKKCGGKEKK